MSRGYPAGPPTYDLSRSSNQSDRPHLNRGLTTAWDLEPSLLGTARRLTAAQHQEQRRSTVRSTRASSTAYEMSAEMEGISSAHASDSLGPRTRRSFYIPSYLVQSRLARRLKQQHEKEQQEQQEQTRRGSASQAAGLSSSSSTTNLSKASAGNTASTHRGVAQRIVERFPELSGTNDKVKPLPTRWNEDDKSAGLEISADGYDVRFSGHLKTADEAASLRTDCSIPKEAGMFYFEVELKSKGKDGLIGVGLLRRSTSLTRQPGWETESFAYHGDDGSVYSGSASGHAYGPRYSSGDVIGCGVNFKTNCIFFTKNGVFLGNAFKDVKTAGLYPAVGLRKPGEYLRLNLGQKPFLFAIDSMMRVEQQNVRAIIFKEDTSKLNPPDDERTLTRKLVAQYLAHEGYVETLKALAQNIKALQERSPSERNSNVHIHDEADDMHAKARQQIRTAILDGHIDQALKYIAHSYPRVLKDEQNHDIYFRLRCRKFIEMMREYAEASVQSNGSSNGHHVSEDSTQMELDDQLQRETSNGIDVDMTTSNDRDLLFAAIEEGQSLRADFGSDPRSKIQTELNDIFALMAYQDPRTSPVGGLLDTSGRASIAEDLNGAILGKPASAALEKVCTQTTTFLDLAAAKQGGEAAFFDVQTDILQIQ